MTALNADMLLRVWEQAPLRHPIEIVLTLLAAAWPEMNAEAWSRVSIGQRDAFLLVLRQALFGRKLETTISCPRCRERIESTLQTDEIITTVPTLPIPQDDLRLEEEGYAIRYRLPTSEDLLALAKATEDLQPTALLQRCIHDVQRHGTSVAAHDLPSALIRKVSEEMARHDPDGHIQIDLTCPACQHAWPSTFDIVTYLWSEVEDWARRLLREVHVLATAYGWSERDILEMSAARRRLYLEMTEA